MKKIALFLFTALLLVGCSQSEDKKSVLSGTVKNGTGLVTLVGSEYEKDIVLNDDGTFSESLDLPYDGYYNAIFGRIPLALYLEVDKGLNLNVDLEDFKNSLEFSGELAKENKFLVVKEELANKDLRTIFKTEPEDFLSIISAIRSDINKELKDMAIDNPKFLESQKNELKYLNASHLYQYKSAYTYLNEVEDVNLPENFYGPIGLIDMADTLEFRKSDNYRRLVQAHYNREADLLQNPGDSNHAMRYINVVNSNFPDSYAKNQLLKEAVGYGLKPDKNLGEVYELYMTYQKDPNLLEEMEEKYAILKNLTPGKKSPEFDYENYNGGKTSLESLRGKYVYIDVWATWCGPCLREIPYLKEVEKDYRNKNIEFVAISIDEAKDYDKWRDMIEERELVGTHLYSGGDAWQSEFTQAYNVRGIPRFILIDPEGNIFDADTYRPSDPKLRGLFDEIL